MKEMRQWMVAGVLCTGLALVGCDSLTEAPVHEPEVTGVAIAILDQEAAFGADTRQQLAQARAVTARYQRFELAEPAGFLLPEGSHCAEGPLGGMGWHYVNFGLVGPPAVLDASRPQVLLYEPQKNGRMKLVAVEWIVPYAIYGSNQPPPTLMGQTFKPNPVLGLWMLHAWIWEHNPDGIFADWNPRINCKYAAH
jgi:hypothetical protein